MNENNNIMNKENRKELKEFLNICDNVERKENKLLSNANTKEERYEVYKKLYTYVFSHEINGRLQEIHNFYWCDPDTDYDDDYIHWKYGLEDAIKEVKEMLTDEEETSYRTNRQIIEEFCEQHLSTHSDWTGTRVETKGKCDSVDDFVDKFMEYIEENQHKC